MKIRNEFGALLMALSCIATLAGCQSKPVSKVAGADTLAITHVVVIDATGKPAKADMTLLVANGRIVRIAPSSSLKLDSGVRVLDGRGKYLIPGLSDMHTHVAEYAPLYFPVLISYGVTSIRNMHAASLDLTEKLKRDIKSGAIEGPRMIANGPMVDGPTSPWPTARKVSSAAEARQAVDDLAAGGADFIKVYTFLSREAYFAIVEEAKKLHLPFAGHVPEAVTALEASNAGQAAIEHLDGVLRGCSSNETALIKRLHDARAVLRKPGSEAEGQRAVMAVNMASLASFDPDKCRSLLAAFGRNHTAQTPTLVTQSTNANRDKSEIVDNPAFRFVPASQTVQWRKVALPEPDRLSNARSVLAKNCEVVHDMQAEGVLLLAGTDVGGASFLAPGDSLHRELELLAACGLTPMQALQTATRNPAIYLHETAERGTLEIGKIADLVLLNANPLTDISNVRRIEAVVVRGHVYSRRDLDELERKEIEQAAKG